MALTFIGATQALVAAALLLFGTVPAMFVFVLISGLFGGSAALTLPALGGSSIPPIQFALVFMVMRLIAPGAGQVPKVRDALRANVLLFCFVAWGVVIAYLGPRIFLHQIDVTPLRGRTESRYISQAAFIYATRSLEPTSQNATTSIYLIGSLLLSLSAYVACSYERGRDLLVKAGVAIAFLHVALGFASVIARGTAADAILEVFRNGNYAQINNSYKGFVRINGIFPEASSYAVYAFVWFVFNFECWFRDIKPRWTGSAALTLAAVMAFSTSTTAYVSLAIYAAIFVLRSTVFPNSLTLKRALILAAASLLMVIIVLAVSLLSPSFARDFSDLIQHVTVDKANSLSGTQRSFWARQGIDAFLFTGGIGIGAGSFRSSSLFTAILGCMGVIGITTFLAFVLTVLKPLRASTYFPGRDPVQALGAAAAWAVLLVGITASLNSATCDPGSEFSVMAGAALAMRGYKRRGAGTRLVAAEAPQASLLQKAPIHL